MTEFTGFNGFKVKDEMARNIAKGRNQAVAYSNYAEMVEALNAMEKDEFKVGQNIYIGTVGVPDLWVYSVEPIVHNFTYESDEGIVEFLNDNVTIQCGYYNLAMLEGQKVDLTTINERLDECFQFGSDFKANVASGITAKKVPTDANDSVEIILANLAAIKLGSGNAKTSEVLSGKTFTNDDGVEYAGAMTNNAGTTKSATCSLDSTNKRVQLTVPANAYYSTTSKLYAAFSSVASAIGLTAAKILKGNTILGIAGTANTGEYTLKKIYGCSSAIKTCSLSNLTVGKPYLVVISSFSGQGWNTAQSTYAKISSYTGCTLSELFYTNDAKNSASRFYKMVPTSSSVTLTTAANETATYTVCE